jgi:hypothetical protein
VKFVEKKHSEVLKLTFCYVQILIN